MASAARVKLVVVALNSLCKSCQTNCLIKTEKFIVCDYDVTSS